MLPFFYEMSATSAMINHGMDVVKQATNLLNPSQIPVITFDQLLFALAKLVDPMAVSSHPRRRTVCSHVWRLADTEMALWNVLED